MVKSRILILAASLALMCGTANARHHRYYGGRPYCHPHVTTVIRTAPPRAVHVNRITKKDRLKMAVAYMKANTYMSAKQYAKITGLKKDIAQAELSVFAQDSKNPIKPVPGKKNLYYLK